MGTTVLILAEKYGIAKSTVWRLKAEISGKIARRELGDMPEPDAEAEEDQDAWDLTITVPTSRLEELLSGLEDDELRSAVMGLGNQEKATNIQAVLQERMKASSSLAAAPEVAAA
jgi:hypothetical protein